MEQFLYEDLYRQEDKHWWHLAKRAAVVELVKRFFPFDFTQGQNDRRGRPKILDLGCGAGKNVEVLSKFGEAWGVDISPEAVEFCKKRGIKNVRIGSSYKTGFANGYFDLVTLLDVLEHADDDRSLKEVSRIMKKNGMLIINVPAFQWLWSRWDEVLHHKRRYTKQSLEKVLEKNGFMVLKISYMFSFLVLPAYLVRQVKSRLSHESYSSDFGLSSPFENGLLFKIAGFERKIWMRISLLFGTSLICVAKKVK